VAATEEVLPVLLRFGLALSLFALFLRARFADISEQFRLDLERELLLHLVCLGVRPEDEPNKILLEAGKIRQDDGLDETRIVGQ